MLVEDLMSTDVVTIPLDVTLDVAVGQLLDHDVGSVVVVQDGSPVGILTESDALAAAHETDQSLSAIPLRSVAHKPVVTTTPTRTVPSVARKMVKEGVKKVPVMDDLELVGIVTLTDIVWNLSDLRNQAAELERAKEEWSTDD